MSRNPWKDPEMDRLALLHPEAYRSALRLVVDDLVAKGDWDGLVWVICNDPEDERAVRAACASVQALRLAHQVEAARRARAKGTSRARAARAERLRQSDAELAAKVRGLRRREELSERAIARRLKVSRRRVSKILARSDS